MDSKKQSPSPDNADAKTAFRKPSNDTANRKYRRHSPVSGSSSSDGSPKREHGSSPIFSREDPRRVSDIRHRRKDDGRELDRDSGRNQYGRSGDSYRHSDRQSSRSSHGYRRHDDYRHDKHTDEEERNYHRLSSRSGRELRDGTRSDPMRQESEPTRSRDYVRHVDKYSREKYDSAGHRSKDKERETLSLEDQKYKDRDLSSDRGGSGRRHTNSNFEEIKSSEWDRHMRDGDGRDEKRDHRRSMGDCKSDRTLYEESRGHRNDSTLRRDNGGHRLKEAYKSDPKELDGQKHTKEERKTYEDIESNRHMDRYVRKPGEHSEDKTIIVNENEESLAKKPKLFSLDKGTDHGKDAVADERQSSSSKQAHGIVGKVTPDKVCANDSEPANDLNAAKVAAMKAAELVNKNLIGVGYMSTDQKKKLLWGSKKSTAAEEQSGHHWDTALFSDRERQEKFNKLMSLRLPWYIWPIVGCEGRPESGSQTRQPRWKQSPPRREAEGTPAGFREAIHCWTPTKRWPHCWSRSLRVHLGFYCTLPIFCDILLYSCERIMFLIILNLWHVREHVLLLEISDIYRKLLQDVFAGQAICGFAGSLGY